jgi:hypothetical protein
MTFSANIHSMNTNDKTCIVTIKDGDTFIVDYVNIGLELNSDGTANTLWVKDNIRTRISYYLHYKK